MSLAFLYPGQGSQRPDMLRALPASGSGEALDALTSAGGVLIIGISLKLLDLTDVKVGNFLPALVFAPALVGIVSLVD